MSDLKRQFKRSFARGRFARQFKGFAVIRDVRITEANDTRITEANDTRVTEKSTNG
jgi:hypothetical protein